MDNSKERDQLKEMMHSVIQRIATGPELSKDLSQDEARIAMKGVLEEAVDPVQAAIFFIALRMKRETEDENKGVLQAIRDATTRVTAEVDQLVDLVDPYNGYNRCVPMGAFLPAVLAACGLPAVTHGAETAPPKFGITAHRVLKAAGLKVDLSVQDVADRLAAPTIGWGYVDQSVYCPSMHNLADLRVKMVKRQVLTTVEVLAKPLVARNATHLVTGFVHKPYPPKYAALARMMGFDTALLVKGIEGGMFPSLRNAGSGFYYHQMGELQALPLEPEKLGISQTVRTMPLPKEMCNEKGVVMDVDAAVQYTAEQGIATLEGQQGPLYDALTYTAALTLTHTGVSSSLQEAAELVRSVVDSGQAKARFI